MVNLLSLDEKQKVHELYVARLSISSLVFLLLAIGVGIIFLLPSFFLILVEERGATERVVIAREAISRSEGSNAIEIVRSVNKKLSTLISGAEKHLALSPFFDTILSKKTKDLKITGFFYRKNIEDEVEEASVIVRGRAPNRDSLLAFVERLREEPLFIDVYLPITDLVESKDIPFSITVIFAEQLQSVL